MTVKYMYFLIGQAGVGKSTLGLLLRKRGCKVADLDLYLSEETKSSPREIISNEGVDVFRDLEYQHLNKLSKDQDVSLIVVGGGAIDYSKSRELIAKGEVIYLYRALLPTIASLRGDYRGYGFLGYLRNWVRRVGLYRALEIEVGPKFYKINLADRKEALKTIESIISA